MTSSVRCSPRVMLWRMRGQLHLWLSAVVAITLSCIHVCPALGQEEVPADIATARELFREGLALSKQEKWEAARVKLGMSLGLKRAALTYYTLAVADMKSAHVVAALEHFRGFLAQPVSDKTEAFLQPARDAVAELEQRVAWVTIRIDPAGVKGLVVRVDGDALPGAALGRRRLIDPGKHEVTARADGYRTQSQTFVAGAGDRRDVRMALDPAPDPEPAERSFPVVPVVLLSVGVSAAVVGLVVGILGNEEAMAAPTRDGPEADAAITKTIVGDVLMGVGGATAVIATVFLILHLTTDDADPAIPTALRPWASGDTFGVQVSF